MVAVARLRRLGHPLAMSRRRKVIAALAAVAVIVGAWWLWPRDVYRYQGKTVEWWFREYAEVYESTDSARRPQLNSSIAFNEMGTNAVPLRVGRINRDLTPSPLEPWTRRLPKRFRPVSKQQEAWYAAVLLHESVQVPKNMLRELLKPAMLITNKAHATIVSLAIAKKRLTRVNK